jgi:hypothetical protein
MQLADLDTKGSRAHFADILPALPDNGKRTARLHFDSLADLVSYLPREEPSGRGRQYWSNENPDFYGSTMQQALDMARDGWSEGAERVAPLLDKVRTERPTARRITRYDVAGAYAVVPRYLAGNPLAMRRHETAKTSKTPIITLVCSASSPWNVSPKAFEAVACAAAAVTDRLEDAGFRVEIISGRRESNDSRGTIEANGENNALGHRSEVFFRAKAADETPNLSRLAFALAHPAIFRRILFAVTDMHPDYDQSMTGCQGYAIALAAVKDRPAGTYVLPALAHLHKVSERGDPLKIFDEVIKTLKDQGCPGLE